MRRTHNLVFATEEKCLYVCMDLLKYRTFLHESWNWMRHTCARMKGSQCVVCLQYSALGQNAICVVWKQTRDVSTSDCPSRDRSVAIPDPLISPLIGLDWQLLPQL